MAVYLVVAIEPDARHESWRKRKPGEPDRVSLISVSIDGMNPTPAVRSACERLVSDLRGSLKGLDSHPGSTGSCGTPPDLCPAHALKKAVDDFRVRFRGAHAKARRRRP